MPEVLGKKQRKKSLCIFLQKKIHVCQDTDEVEPNRAQNRHFFLRTSNSTRLVDQVFLKQELCRICFGNLFNRFLLIFFIKLVGHHYSIVPTNGVCRSSSLTQTRANLIKLSSKMTLFFQSFFVFS